MTQETTEPTGSMADLVPHFRCDCVPALGLSHCHRCSDLAGPDAAVAWDQAPCRDMVEGLPYRALLAADETRSLLVVSRAFDAKQAARPAGPRVTPVQAARAARALGVATQEQAEAHERGGSGEDAGRTGRAPAKMVPAPPRTRLVSGLEHQALREEATEPSEGPAAIRRSRWRFTDLAQEQMAELGQSAEYVEEILDGPHTTTPGTGGTSSAHHGNGLRILVDADGACVVSVTAMAEPPRGQQTGSGTAPKARPLVKRKSHSGGAGRKMPSNIKEMVKLLEAHGFVAEAGRRGHYAVTHPQHPSYRGTVTSTAGDRRTYRNAVAEIRRETGIDITR